MATFDGTSPRTRIEDRKVRLKVPYRRGRLTPEAALFIDGVMLLMEPMVTVLPERTTKKTSANSSLPRSGSDGTDGTARKRTNSRGRSRKTCDSASPRQKSATRTSPVSACSGCGRSMASIEASGHGTRTLVDIVFEVVTTHAGAGIKTCPDRRGETRGGFPDTMPGPLRYGHGIIAFAIHRMAARMVPLRRVAQTLRALTGRGVAEATLPARCERLARALEDRERAAIAYVPAAPVPHVDETSIRINGKNHWPRDCGTGDITPVFRHPNRGRAAMNDISIIPRYGGVPIHDRRAGHLSFGHCGHAPCGAHLERDLRFIVDSNNHRWARHMPALLSQTARKVGKSPDRALRGKDFKALRKRHGTILTKGRRELPPVPPRTDGKRGRIARSDAENLLEALAKHEYAVLMFARNPDVPYTNNRAERDFRMARARQKISGCFRSSRHAVIWCRVYSYLKSAGYRGYNPLTAIQIALKGNAVDLIPG